MKIQDTLLLLFWVLIIPTLFLIPSPDEIRRKNMNPIQLQQDRMDLYKKLIDIASCPEEDKALRKAYEISRLIHIKNPDVIERGSWLLDTPMIRRKDGLYGHR